MDMAFLNEYVVLVVTGICLCVGYILKHSFKWLNNDLIPCIMGILGVALNFWLNGFAMSPEILLGGLASGLASTGIHQGYQYLTSKTDKQDEDRGKL